MIADATTLTTGEATAVSPGKLVYVIPGTTSCDPVWEEAYRRFESPAQEIQKFVKRLIWFGARYWDRSARAVELFCGRGNGLIALQQLGFEHVEGVDLSPTLLQQYSGNATCYVADCRELPFADQSKDLVVIQGGLHHLPKLPHDLEQTLRECRRVLACDGRLVVVEPWPTPFLHMIHFISRQDLVRRCWPACDAFHTMVQRELTTYRQWLGMPGEILSVFDQSFVPLRCAARWGKLFFLGRPRA